MKNAPNNAQIGGISYIIATLNILNIEVKSIILR